VHTLQSWPIPDSYRDHAGDLPDSAEWLPGLSVTAARLAADWEVEPDGPATHGWVSMVWPVRDNAGRRYVLKVSPPLSWSSDEPRCLQAWAEHTDPEAEVRMVPPARASVPDRAVLLPRLDADRPLQRHPDIVEANAIIGGLLAGISEVIAPPGMPTLAEELAMTREQLDPAGPVPAHHVERARSTVDDLLAELARHGAPLSLLHRDLHYLNVLHTLPDEPAAWVGIDPLPLAGLREWELTPMLRNRWDDAAATGDPDRALRRRVDQVAEIAGLDPFLVRRCSQIVAAEALQRLLPDRTDHLFAAPYSIMVGW
jgi:streptomycin 6-kinase